MTVSLLALALAATPKIDVRLPRNPRTVVGMETERRVRAHVAKASRWITKLAAQDDYRSARYELAVVGENRALDLGRSSTLLAIYNYTGGAHGMTSFVTVNLRAANGKVREVRLRDLFSSPDYRSVVETALLTKLRDMPGASWVESGEVREFTPAQLEVFTHDRDGRLTFYFEPYALGPYSSGSFEVTLSKAELGSTYRG